MRALLVVLFLGGCGPKAVELPAKPTRLVVMVVLDQLGADTLLRYEKHLSEEGLVRRLRRTGVWLRGRYPYANTFTAPGHATIATGKAPRESCIATNRRWDEARGESVAAADDGKSVVFGRKGVFASPAPLCAVTVGDRLRSVHKEAKIVSLSLKDRAAVLSGGKQATWAVWYDAKIPGFTTSSYYGDAPPKWLEHWRAQRPIQQFLTVWNAEDPATLQTVLGDDDGPGEGNWYGLGTTFPHKLAETERPFDTFRASPQGTEALLSLAQAAVQGEGLGMDAVPDLLQISVSGTDYVGHVFGPDSWEYLDNLIRVDRALGEWYRALEQATNVELVLTSDHGHAAVPERTGGGRLVAPEVALALDGHLDARFGENDWVRTFLPPFLYLAPVARANPQALSAAREFLTGYAGVSLAAPVSEARGWLRAEQPAKRAVALGIPATTVADFVVFPQKNWPFDALNLRDTGGTSHGTPWKYDREVPVLVSRRLPTAPHIDMRDVAGIALTLLGIGDTL